MRIFNSIINDICACVCSSNMHTFVFVKGFVKIRPFKTFKLAISGRDRSAKGQESKLLKWQHLKTLQTNLSRVDEDHALFLWLAAMIKSILYPANFLKPRNVLHFWFLFHLILSFFLYIFPFLISRIWLFSYVTS